MSEVTVQAASDFLGVTQRTVINYIRSKEIEAVKVGKSWFIKKPSLDAFSLRYGIRATPQQDPKQDEPAANPPAKEAGEKTEGAPSSHSVTNLRLFTIAADVLKTLTPEALPGESSFKEKVDQLRLQALENLGAGYYSFDPMSKASLYRRSRERVGGLLALLYFASKDQAEGQPLIEKIESELMPAYSALIRRMEKKRERS
jgi:excisionase family DNA binding protein